MAHHNGCHALALQGALPAPAPQPASMPPPRRRQACARTRAMRQRLRAAPCGLHANPILQSHRPHLATLVREHAHETWSSAPRLISLPGHGLPCLIKARAWDAWHLELHAHGSDCQFMTSNRSRRSRAPDAKALVQAGRQPPRCLIRRAGRRAAGDRARPRVRLRQRVQEPGQRQPQRCVPRSARSLPALPARACDQGVLPHTDAHTIWVLAASRDTALCQGWSSTHVRQ